MTNLRVGFLFKKKYVTYKDNKYEIFEFIDYVSGISFTNTQYKDIFNVISGSNVGLYAKSFSDEVSEGEYVFFADDINKAIENNDYNVNFIEIRKKKISSTAKYYLRNDKGTGLVRLSDKDFLLYLEKENKKRQVDFDEDEFKKNSDISFMYSSIKKR